MTEANSITNFNFGFSTYKSDILIHLSQWQYWWWFWFSLFWVMYFFIIIRLVHKRTFQFNPIINTSIRGHGKWGDFLVALIPLSWCGNILVNSNFILRMIEWQNEGSLFTIRVQGKQWYWRYKFDASAANTILSAPKNIGHNRWFVSTPNESYCADTYYQALYLGTQLEFKEQYLHELAKEKISRKGVNSASRTRLNLSVPVTTPVTTLSNLNFFKTFTAEFNAQKYLQYEQFRDVNARMYASLKPFYFFPRLDERTHYASSLAVSKNKKPLTFVAGVLNKHNLESLKNASTELNKPIFFTAKFFLNNGAIEKKIPQNKLVWGFEQKRYKRLKTYLFLPKVQYTKNFLTDVQYTTVYSKEDEMLKNPFRLKSSLIGEAVTSTWPQLLYTPQTNARWAYDSVQAGENNLDEFNYQRSIKYNRHRGELVPVNLARRLLRTKRTLVLPAHVNMTVVTNSYDVVHSWFIPGLGLKLDCVPGRSTHHSFYIDNVGFYYGQCAEICGRYHHHMPIRLCALPFEQFLVWWQRRGLRRLHRLHVINNSASGIDTNSIKFRYKW